MVDNTPTEMIVLSGGLGTRLRPLVSDVPKPMARFNGIPFLDFLLSKYEKQGIKHFVLSTGYMGEEIETYFKDWPGETKITISREEKLLGTGGAINNAIGQIDGSEFFVVNGDSYCDLSLSSLYRQFKLAGTPVCIALSKVEDVSAFGAVSIDEDAILTDFSEKGEFQGAGLVNAGIYVMSKAIQALFPDKQKFSIEADVFQTVADRGCISGYPVVSRLYDIGTPESFRRAETELRSC